MPRTPKAVAPTTPDNTNEEAIQQSLENADKVQTHLAVIDEKFGSVVPYNRDRVMEEARFYVNQASESYLEAGRRLILLREHEEQGNFLKALETIGVSKSTAYRLISVSTKLANFPTLGTLPRSKAFELAVLDDADLEKLEQGGTVAHMQFDEIDTLSTSELRRRLRESEDEKVATEQLLGAEKERTTKLERQIKRMPDVVPFTEATESLRKEITAKGLEIENALFAFSQLVGEATRVIDEQQPSETEQEGVAFAMCHALDSSVHLMAKLQEGVYAQFASFLETRYTALKQAQGAADAQ